MKTIIVSAVLALTPALAMAECGWSKKEISANTCGEGQVFDVQSGSCVDQTTS